MPSMNNPRPATVPSPIRLPAEALTRDGAAFNPRMDIWAFRTPGRTSSFNFGPMRKTAPSLIDSMKATVTWYLENQSVDHATDMFNRFRHLFVTLAKSSGRELTQIDAESMLNYRTLLTPSTSWYLSNLAGAIKKWAALGWPGVNPDAVNLLNELRLKGNTKGGAVLTMDPNHGPLTDIERQGLVDALKNAWSNGEITLEDSMLCWLSILIAPRPTQLAILKVCDLVTVTLADGSASYVLRLPRAKQRGRSARDELKDRRIVPEIGRLLARHADEVRTRLSGLMRDAELAPMFPARVAAESWPTGFEWHAAGNTIGHRVKTLLEELGTRSERTGVALNITASRLRRTLGTNAASEGSGELVIADLLDHSDTQNVGVYVEGRPEIVERIDRKVAARMAPLAQAFAGVLTEQGNAWPAGGAISDPRMDAGRAVGGCGTHEFCGLAAPAACYTCTHFQAWLDGPHEAVLDHLLAERERLAVTADPRIAAVNDRTILAVAEVVRLCSKRETSGAAIGHD